MCFCYPTLSMLDNVLEYPRFTSTDLDGLACKIQSGGRIYLRMTHRTQMKDS
jgi:hypothetical protein